MTKIAFLIGINYLGQEGQLAGCVNDISDMWEFLSQNGYNQFFVLADEPAAYRGSRTGAVIEPPTRANIVRYCAEVVGRCARGDELFFHYSGHGSQERAADGRRTEEDGLDETICPVDYARAGMIRDGELKRILVDAALARGVHLRVLLDCCHSGTGLDLAWNMKPARPGQRSAAPRPGTATLCDAVNAQVDDLMTTMIRARLAQWIGREAGARVEVSLETLAGGASAATAAPPSQSPSQSPQECTAEYQCWGEGAPAQRGPLSQIFGGSGGAFSGGLTIGGLLGSQLNPNNVTPVPVAAPMAICISGCRDNQTSADASFGGRPNGALTRTVIDCIRGESAGKTAVALLGAVDARLARGGYEQQPQLSASGSLPWTMAFM